MENLVLDILNYFEDFRVCKFKVFLVRIIRKRRIKKREVKQMGLVGAEELARRVKEVPMAKVNLIPLSPVDHRPDFRTPPESTMLMFLDVLMKHHVQTMIRRSRGKEREAACGQLKVRWLKD